MPKWEVLRAAALPLRKIFDLHEPVYQDFWPYVKEDYLPDTPWGKSIDGIATGKWMFRPRNTFAVDAESLWGDSWKIMVASVFYIQELSLIHI